MGLTSGPSCAYRGIVRRCSSAATVLEIEVCFRCTGFRAVTDLAWCLTTVTGHAGVGGPGDAGDETIDEAVGVAVAAAVATDGDERVGPRIPSFSRSVSWSAVSGNFQVALLCRVRHDPCDHHGRPGKNRPLKDCSRQKTESECEPRLRNSWRRGGGGIAEARRVFCCSAPRGCKATRQRGSRL